MPKLSFFVARRPYLHIRLTLRLTRHPYGWTGYGFYLDITGEGNRPNIALCVSVGQDDWLWRTHWYDAKSQALYDAALLRACTVAREYRRSRNA